jgi:hypothetical protein
MSDASISKGEGCKRTIEAGMMRSTHLTVLDTWTNGCKGEISKRVAIWR